MTTVRLMREVDLDAVRRVDAAAFGGWREQLTGKKEELPPRTRANVRALHEEDPQGCFVAGHERVSIQVMALDPERTNEESFRALVEDSEGLAHAHQKREIIVPVNARHDWALQQLLEAGYSVQRLSVRLLLAGTEAAPSTEGTVSLSRWAG